MNNPINFESQPQLPLSDAVDLAPERAARSNNLLQLIEMRWFAVAGQLLTVLLVGFGLDVELPIVPMISLLALLAVFNVASWLRSLLNLPVGDLELFIALLVDVVVLTGQLYYSGGSANPFIYLYLLQVVLGTILLRAQYVWAVVLITSACFMLLTQWHQPLVLPDAQQHSASTYYVVGLLLCFLINASMLVIFIGRISSNLRRRDARLADMRQHAVEEEHIVRMGLLASGAAHELGTPLATLSVILGDWARMTPFAAEPELREEIEQMQVQVNRCKSIVTGILQSAGETRGDAPEESTLHTFLDDLIQSWQHTRPAALLAFERTTLPDLPIISDTALKQMIDNVLDNALEAAPKALIVVQATECDGHLLISVKDKGPGFSPQMLAHLGKPYESSKGRLGGGLGLFLSVNVARKLGGTLEAFNRPEGGAELRITLPLQVLMPSE